MEFGEFFEGLHVGYVTSDLILVVIRVTIYIQEFFEGYITTYVCVDLSWRARYSAFNGYRS